MLIKESWPVQAVSTDARDIVKHCLRAKKRSHRCPDQALSLRHGKSTNAQFRLPDLKNCNFYQSPRVAAPDNKGLRPKPLPKCSVM